MANAANMGRNIPGGFSWFGPADEFRKVFMPV